MTSSTISKYLSSIPPPFQLSVFLSQTECNLFCVIRAEFIDQLKREASKSNMRCSSNHYANKQYNQITGICLKNLSKLMQSRTFS